MIDKTFSRLIEDSSNIVVFTGAGISTESGIPDFRSPTGIWKKYQPIEFKDFLSSEDVRVEAWKRKFEIDKNISKAKPNIGHFAIAKLVSDGKVKKIITQNIDNLHQESGIPNDLVIELHGNTTYAKCLDCGKRYDLALIMKNFKKTNKPPYCDMCSGVVKAGYNIFWSSNARKRNDALTGIITYLRLIYCYRLIIAGLSSRRFSYTCQKEWSKINNLK
jgi:NAD-dependent deacetylase